MLPRHAHLLGQMRQREGGCATLKPIVAVLPGDAVKDDGRKLVACGRKVRFSDAASVMRRRMAPVVSVICKSSCLADARRWCAKTRSGKMLCRLNGCFTRDRFIVQRRNQRGVGPMVWRRFCFWGPQSFDRFGSGQQVRSSVAHLLEAICALMVRPVDEDPAEPVVRTGLGWSEP